MKHKHRFMAGILALVFTLALTGCPLDSDGGDKDKDWVLPATVGANEVGGNVWYTLNVKVDYAADGTYVRSISLRNNQRSIETGAYSWNETDRTITHKPETILFDRDINNMELLNRQEYRQTIEEQIRSWSNWFPGWIASQDFTESEWITSRLDEAFAGWRAVYTIVGDALLMQEALPENIPPDHLSGQDYAQSNTEYPYTFGRDGTFTFTGNWQGEPPSLTVTGTFAYNGTGWSPQVFLLPAVIDGKTMLEWYNSVEPYEGHGFPSGAAYKAAVANGQFQMISYVYDPNSKKIGR